VVALDLYKYTFHRLQHAIPFLWAMHSFHHSANAVTFITGARHFWLERVLSDAFLPIMAILFLFGTAWVPRPDEYPATELVPPERVDIINSVIWPVRYLRHRDSKE
jgi:sterol desaturase/sphingolipid hydroxylase (fatty acid hydroxylase superfamily)